MQNPFRAIGKLKARHAIYCGYRNEPVTATRKINRKTFEEEKEKGRYDGNMRKITERETEAGSISDTRSNTTRSSDVIEMRESRC